MQHRIDDIARALGADFWGDGSVMISGVAQPDEAGEGDLALAMDPRFAKALPKGQAVAAVLWSGANPEEFGLRAVIFAPRSRYALSGVTRMFSKLPALPHGIHPSSVVDPTADLGEGISVGPFVVIGPNVRIGKGARIYSHCSIAEGSVIGEGALLYAGVHIGHGCKIGDNFIAQPGAVIGADGFSFVTPNPGSIEEARSTGAITEAESDNAYARIDSLGGVTIGDFVEIGSNSCVDRGTLTDTRIGNGTKVDNQVQIAHNVQIGDDCLLCGQAGVAGSTVIGDRVVVGGATAIADHLKVGSDVVIAGGSGVASNVPSKRVMMGNPAMKMELNVEAYKALRRLPRILKRLAKDTE
ncbi:MAG: UDP-3-O-(3-hydroxymyristoyl)glucosamine N-acyltransferase [Pseudomonadota bacterium]